MLVEGRNRRARDFTLTHLAARVSALRADQDDALRPVDIIFLTTITAVQSSLSIVGGM